MLPQATPDLGPQALALARQAIAAALGLEPEPKIPADQVFTRHAASFVTLTTRGSELRGCIGSLEAHRGLAEDIMSNARAAAFQDPRFPPVNEEEWPEIQVEVSILSPLSPLPAKDEDEALAQLRPGIDGVVFTSGPYRSTFLPQVWEQLPAPRTFIAHLKAKAGLPANYWSDDVRLFRYTVDKYRENRHER